MPVHTLTRTTYYQPHFSLVLYRKLPVHFAFSLSLSRSLSYSHYNCIRSPVFITARVTLHFNPPLPCTCIYRYRNMYTRRESFNLECVLYRILCFRMFSYARMILASSSHPLTIHEYHIHGYNWENIIFFFFFVRISNIIIPWKFNEEDK